MRFDSGDQDEQFKKLRAGCVDKGRLRKVHYRLTPNTIFEDGYTASKTARNEAFCEGLAWPRERRQYGYGGYFITVPEMNPFTRNNVSAVYKLCMTGCVSVMKHSGTKGKESLPGRPVILRAIYGGPSIVAQQGEKVDAYAEIGTAGTDRLPTETTLSPATKLLVAACITDREPMIAACGEDG